MSRFEKPDPRLERHLLGETPAHLADSTRRALGEPTAKADLQNLRQSDEEILRALPADRMASSISQRLRQEPRPKTRWIPAASLGGAALALAGLMLLLPWHLDGTTPHGKSGTTTASGQPAPDTPSALASNHPTPPSENGKPAGPVGAGRTESHDTGKDSAVSDTSAVQVAWADDDIRLKGGARRLSVHRIGQDGHEARRLADGDSAHRGDLLQVGVLAGPRRWIAVLSVDGRGQVTRHLPESGDSAVEAASGLTAPHSYQLDDAPGFERFLLVQSRRKFSLADVETTVGKLGAKGSPGKREEHFESILLVK